MANEQNLIPFKPGQSGNPAGKPKGARSLSTIIREFLEQELDWSLVPVKPERAKHLAEKYRGKAGWEALVAVAAGKAMSGDTKAMAWLSKAGYGDKITHDFDGGLFSQKKLVIEVVQPKTIEDDDGNQAEGVATADTGAPAAE